MRGFPPAARLTRQRSIRESTAVEQISLLSIEGFRAAFALLHHPSVQEEEEMVQPAPSSRRWSGWVAVLAAAAALVGGLFRSGGVGFPRSIFEKPKAMNIKDNRTSILSVFATSAFDWSSSTTPAPLSATAVLVKQILANPSALPPGLDNAIVVVQAGGDVERVVDVNVSRVRDFVSSKVLREVQELCAASSSLPSTPNHSSFSCDPNEIDPEFGTTPLQMAELWGSEELVKYLLSIGADPTIFDNFGRQARNMTFAAFSANSKKAADARVLPDADPEYRCEIPEVTVPLYPAEAAQNDMDETEISTAVEEWDDAVRHALSEVRRLVSEGEPVMVRNVLPCLQSSSASFSLPSLKYLSADDFAAAWGHRPVDVGGVPYAKNFDLFNERMTLENYMTATTTTTEGATPASKEGARPPNYVFQIDTEACVEGRDIMGKIVDAALPSLGDRPIVCPPASGIRGLESVHYYLGGRLSGAPFHIHSDALNLAVSGKKKWWVVTPREAVWSRRRIKDYAEEGKGGPWSNSAADGEDGVDDEANRPMECVQSAGDLVYVPGEWGHAAMNLEDGTFG